MYDTVLKKKMYKQFKYIVSKAVKSWLTEQTLGTNL